MNLRVCINRGLFVSLNVFLLATFFNRLTVASANDCSVNGSDEESKSVLGRLSPLKGKRFKTTEYSEGKKTISTFEIGICTALRGEDVAVLQTLTDSKQPDIVFGRLNATTASSGENYIYLSYHNGDVVVNSTGLKRMASVMIVCDLGSELSDAKQLEKYDKDFPNYSYVFEVGSRVACKINDGLSGGGIFCIMFFTGLFTYLLLGFLYQRLVVGAKGLEQIPNYSFWRDFGNLQADGCDFICRCGPRQEAHSYRGIDERLPRDEERDDQLLNM